MKSPDDQLNDDLRNALRSRFDDFEVKPGADLKKSIFSQLRTWQQEQTSQRTWVVCLLLAILFTGTLFYSSSRDSEGQELTEAVKADNINAVTTAAGTFELSAENQALVKPSANLAVATASVTKKKSTAQEWTPTRRKGIAITDVNIENASKARNVAHRTPNSFAKNNAALTAPDSFVASESVVNEKPTEKLEIAGISYLNSLPANFDQPSLMISDSIVYFEKVTDKNSNTGTEWTLLVGITPVKSFQILHILPNPDRLYRNFQFPASASFESVGYKLNAGVEKNGLQLLMSYGNYRQSVRYEVAGNEFEVVPNGSNAEARRKYTAVSSERTLRLAGLGLRKQFVPKAPALRTLYAVAGAEFTREFTHGRNMVWANAGFGRQVRVGRNTALQIGPFFEYGFTKLTNAEGSFQVKPYQVGLSVILRNKLLR